ncbi:hypothetical protein FRC03_004986 [Tulasnella sp. 419]|nr:hypothetical protein FRC03_004986 [Tulasnella sp. 419]
MTANPPSFSSFPPSFSSFPDLKSEDESSKEKEEKRKPKRVKDEERHSSRHHSSRRDRSRSRERHSKSQRHRSRSHERSKDSKSHRSRHHDSDDSRKRKRKEHSPSRKPRDIDADYEYLSRKSKQRDKDLDTSGAMYESRSRYDFPDDVAQSAANLFIEDGKGDEGNIRYGGLHRYAVPKFKRMGYGTVLGVTDGAWRLKPNGPNVELSLKKQVHAPQLSSSKWSSYISSIQPRRLTAPKHQDQYSEDSGFIPLPSTRVKQSKEPAYRSITAAEADEESDASSSSSSSQGGRHSNASDEEFTVPSTSAFTERNIALTQATKSNPTSASAWMNLLRHSASSAPTQQARAEISLSILDKALDAHYSNKHNPAFLCQYLLFGSLIWPAAKLRDEWEIAVKKVEIHRRDLFEQTTLWMDYLTFKLKDSGIDGLQEAVARVWQAVARAEVAQVFELECFKLRVLWRCCVGLAEAGYTERGVAAFQSQIELTLFAPAEYKSKTFSQNLESLEEFWESECPRFGEVGANGWCNFNPSTSDAQPATSAKSPMQEEPRLDHEDSYVKWAAAESFRDRTGRYPLRSSDPMSDEDPYSTVLFSDIRGFLYNPSATGNEAKILLIYAFLQFLGLYFPGLSAYLEEQSSPVSTADGNQSSSNLDSIWSDTRFKDPSVISSVFFPKRTSSSKHSLTDSNAIGKESLNDSQQKSGFGAVKDWRWGVLTPLQGHGSKGEGRMWEADVFKIIDTSFVRRVFEQTSAKVSSAAFDEHWLAFEAICNIKSTIKLSRRMLQNDRDSLHRWASHAKLERIRGKPDEAVKIYEACLEGTSLGANPRKNNSETLYWDWAQLIWLSGGRADVILLRAADMSGGGDVTVSSVSILRAKKKLDAWIEERHAADEEDGRHVLLALVNIRALLELLSGDLTRALSIYDKVDPQRFTSSIRTQRLLGEMLAISSTLLAYYHTTGHHRSPVPPSILQGHVSTLIPLYTRNTILLGVWLESERGESVWGRVKSVVRDVILGDSEAACVGGWLWAIWQETVNWAWEVGRVKGVLSKCTESERSRMSPSLWRIAIELEFHLNQLDRAKSLLFRAVGECPWTKEFYLVAFKLPLRHMFTIKDLEQWSNTMLERRLRVRLGLEDYSDAVDGHGDDGSNRDSDMQGGDDELEEVIKERLRLMPY